MLHGKWKMLLSRLSKDILSIQFSDKKVILFNEHISNKQFIIVSLGIAMGGENQAWEVSFEVVEGARDSAKRHTRYFAPPRQTPNSTKISS